MPRWPSLSQVVQLFLIHPGKWPERPEMGCLSTQHTQLPTVTWRGEAVSVLEETKLPASHREAWDLPHGVTSCPGLTPVMGWGAPEK